MIESLEEQRPHDYLVRLAGSDAGVAYKRVVLRELDLRDGHTVVDLGCGPGADLPVMARRVGSGGRVIGVDHDPDAVVAACRAVDGCAHVEVRTGDVHAPGLRPGSVDRLRTDRVLQHVDDPGLVLAEAYLALRPGGRAVVAEPDWGTLAIDHPDAGIAEAYREFVLGEVVRNPTIGRQVPRLTAAAGFVVGRVEPVTAVFRDVHEADRVLGFARVTRRAVEAGHLDAAAGRRWLDHLVGGPFYASLTVVVTTADRPEDIDTT